MMFVSGAQAAGHLENIVHLETQQADNGVDLTVSDIYQLTDRGELDFGGSEFAASPREKCDPTLDSPQHDYGWWTLEAGSYIVRYNESLRLSGGRTAVIQPLDRLLQIAVTHPTVYYSAPRDPLEMLLVVGRNGARLKENCRISRLLIGREGNG